MDALNIFEFAAKTVRHISREFRVAWVSGVEAAQRDAADALCEKEAEEEVAEPQEFIIASPEDLPGFRWNCGEMQSADFDDEPTIERFGLKLKPSDYDTLGDSLQRITDAERSSMNARTPSSTALDSVLREDEAWSKGWRRGWESAEEAYSVGRYRKAPAASTTAVEDPSGAGTPLLASEADSIKDVLSQHYPTVTGRTVTCRCRLELGSRQQHWDHQADLIAGALKVRARRRGEK